MKRLIKKSQNVVKGMPSAVVLSIVIHAALFLLAGMLVVFTVVKKEEQKFEPPKVVDRPKMKLRKPKVKVKKTSKPKPTTRIVTKVNRTSMPDIQLPEMSGMDDGLAGGMGGFDLMPDLGEVTLFGSGQSIGNDFEGTFYDSKRDRQGRTLSVDTTGFEWRNLIHKFLQRDWSPSIFARYYRSPKKLYATNFVVPLNLSAAAPLSFGDKDAVGALWMVHYKGQLVYKEAITFRFWGMGDEFLAVRVDGRFVLALDWPSAIVHKTIIGNLWDSDSADSRKYFMGNNRAVVGDWITLEPGVPLDMEILIGDNGGAMAFFLAVEVEGVEYERNRQGGPILPAFKTAEPSHDLLDILYKDLAEGEICLTNGPVFRDYDLSGGTAAHGAAAVESSFPEKALSLGNPVENKIRTWDLADGRLIEAAFVLSFGEKVVLKNARGKTYKIKKEQFSADDREYIELAQPPVFNVNFLKSFHQERFHGGFYDVPVWTRPSEEWGHYGIQLKQTSPGEYNHELHVEIFVIGRQRGGTRYILLDHQQTSFTPAAENQRVFEFHSDRKVVLNNFRIDNLNRGEKYAGYLVTITDTRGEMIAVESSSKWLIANLERLKNLSAGNYFDKTCTRTFPSRPKSPRY